MQVSVELSVPSVGLSPSLQTLQAAVNASVQKVPCLPAFLTQDALSARLQLGTAPMSGIRHTELA